MFQPLDRNKPSHGNQPLDRGKSSDRGQPLSEDRLSDRGKPCPYGYDELLRYALESDSLLYPVEEHINTCNICRQQVESLISTNSSLVRKLYRSRCPDVDILARYSADLASLSEGILVFYHLRFCPLCTKDLQEMKSILEDDIL